MFIGQGADGTLEGTPGDKPGIGPGDGVMIAGDVRTLARDFCASGVGGQAPNDCAQIAPGNSLAPVRPRPLRSPAVWHAVS
jgi:hypothetical protein